MSSVTWTNLGRQVIGRLGIRLSAARGNVAILLLLLAAAAADDRKPSQSWAPPDIDHVYAPVNIEAPCALGPVLKRASERVAELVVNMQRFSAAEQVTFDELDRHGTLHTTKTATFSYVAYIHEAAPQQLTVEEYRNDTVALQEFPSRLASLGTAAFALLFHPHYLQDFAVTCEGLSEWRGRRAWRLHMAQIRPNNFRGYRLANRYFRVMLKARAWIDAETFEVLRLETDLRDPIPDIPLLLEHVIVDYAMVDFPARKLQLWLPQEAEIYMDYRGRQYRHRHAFSHFQLFWVDTEQSVKVPQVAASEPFHLPPNVTSNSAPAARIPVETAAAPAPVAMPNVPAKSALEARTGEERPPASATANPTFAPATSDHSAPDPPAPQPTASTASVLESAAARESADRASTPPGQRAESGAPASTRLDRDTIKPEPITEECSDCLRVLISLKDVRTGELNDNWRSQAQDAWIKQNSERLLKGKGPRVRIVSYRQSADYNIIWSAGLLRGAEYRTVRAEVKIKDLGNGNELFSASCDSRFWEVDHPDSKCLQDAIAFLQNGQKTPQGYVFPHHYDPSSPAR